MTDVLRFDDRSNNTAEPPGGGRQDHDTMRAAAMRPVTGPASTDTLAASGGLDVPGGEPHPELAAAGRETAHGGDPPAPAGSADHAREIIPGEHDATTLTHRQPGAIGGQFSGGDIPAAGPIGSMDERTAYERAREGGGERGRSKGKGQKS